MLNRLAAAVSLCLLAGLVVWFGSSPAHALDKDCGDFANQKDAQLYFLNKGGPKYDPDNLDADGDGIACESNPCPCYYGKTPPTGSDAGAKQVIRQKATVVAVSDGDTIKVRLRAAGPVRRVRLLGVDTPEVFGTTECGGVQASRSMKRMLREGSRVRLVSDPTQAYKDSYGRLLRYVVKISTGKDLSRVQIYRGWGKVFVYHHNPFQRVASYRKAQRQAKAANRGIWGRC